MSQEGQRMGNKASSGVSGEKNNTSNVVSESCVNPREDGMNKTSSDGSESCVNTREDGINKTSSEGSESCVNPREDGINKTSSEGYESCVNPRGDGMNKTSCDGSGSCVNTREVGMNKTSSDGSGSCVNTREVGMNKTSSDGSGSCVNPREDRINKTSSEGSESCVNPREDGMNKTSSDGSGSCVNPREDGMNKTSSDGSGSCVNTREDRMNKTSSDGSGSCVNTREVGMNKTSSDGSGSCVNPREDGINKTSSEGSESCVNPREDGINKTSSDGSGSCVNTREDRMNKTSSDGSGSCVNTREVGMNKTSSDRSGSCVNPREDEMSKASSHCSVLINPETRDVTCGASQRSFSNSSTGSSSSILSNKIPKKGRKATEKPKLRAKGFEQGGRGKNFSTNSCESVSRITSSQNPKKQRSARVKRAFDEKFVRKGAKEGHVLTNSGKTTFRNTLSQNPRKKEPRGRNNSNRVNTSVSGRKHEQRPQSAEHGGNETANCTGATPPAPFLGKRRPDSISNSKLPNQDTSLPDLNFKSENVLSAFIPSHSSSDSASLTDCQAYLKKTLANCCYTVTKDELCPGEVLLVFPGKHDMEKALAILRGRIGEDGLRIHLLDPVVQLKRQLVLKQKQVIAQHTRKCNSVNQSIEKISGKGKGKGKSKFIDVSLFNMKETLVQKQHELERQKEEFTSFCEIALASLDSLRDDLHELMTISNRFNREKRRLESALPIYARKSQIIQTIKDNQVTVLIGETGSGKSTQIGQYLYDAGLADKRQIVCTQPRKVAATSLAQQVSREMGQKVGKLVGYMVGSQKHVGPATRLQYTTDHALLMECIKDNTLSKYSCIIIDEAHERSVNTDLLIGMIKHTLPKRPDLKVIITSATINPKLFQDYFGGCPVVEVSGRTFPVEVVWKQGDSSLNSGSDYVSEAIDKVLEIHRTEEPGDVLVFLTCPAEIDRAVTKVCSKVNPLEVICLPLHGKLLQEDQQKVFQQFPGKRKVVFSTNCAETSITIPGVKFVVDTGMAKEMKYEEKRGLNILEVSVISRSSADQRKGRAGRTDSGKCYRLYTEKDYTAMEKCAQPEILRVHLGQTLVKLMDLGISDPFKFDYVEAPSKESINRAVASLVQLGAIKNGSLTELGRKLSKVPLEPRLGRLLFEGIDSQVGLECLVLCSVATVNGSVFFRMGTEDEKKEADMHKFEFCQSEGDFLTLLAVYKEWWNEDPRDRGRWCFEKSLNAKALRLAEDTMRDLKFSLEHDLSIKNARTWKWSPLDDAVVNETLQKIVMSCFSENLCVFSGHSRVGYKNLYDGEYVQLHPSSAINFIGTEPKFLVYEKTLRTTQDFIINVTPIEEAWLLDAVDRNSIQLDLENLEEEILRPFTIKCSEKLRRMMLLPSKEKLQSLQQRVSTICDGSKVYIECKADHGVIKTFIPTKHHKTAAEVINKVLDEGRQQLQREEKEIPLNQTSRVRFVVGKGLAVQQILMEDMYRSVVVRKIGELTPEQILSNLNSYGGLVEYSVKNETLFAMYEDAEQAMKAVAESSVAYGFRVWPYNEFQGPSPCRREKTFKIKVSWNRRIESGRAKVDFTFDRDNLYKVMSILPANGQRPRPLLIGNTTAKVQKDKWDANSIFIQNLNQGEKITKNDIKLALECLSPSIGITNPEQQIQIHYQRRPKTTDEELDSQKEELKKLVMKILDDDASFEVSLRNPNQAFTAFAIIYFRDPIEGANVAKELDGITTSRLEDWDVELKITCFLKTCLTCPQYIYDVIEPGVKDVINDLRQECASECGCRLTVDLLQPKEGSKRVALQVQSECMTHYLEAIKYLNSSFQGDKVDLQETCSQRAIKSAAFRRKLREIEQATKTVLRAAPSGDAIHVYGTSDHREQAAQEIQAFLLDMILTGSKTEIIELRGPDKPRGLLKELLRRFGSGLKSLYDAVPEICDISVDLRTHVITLNGTSEALVNLMAKFEKAKQSLPAADANFLAEDQELCPACFCEVDNPYQLATCGHVYCRGCVINLIEAKQFPLTCAYEDCSTLLAIHDVDNLKEWDIVNDIITASLESFVAANQDKARHCPSPDCPMVYRVRGDGKMFKCSECETEVCTCCHKSYHVGISCEDYALSKTEIGQEHLVEKWMREDPLNRKRCPKCRTGIEKNQGCSYMGCKCGAHIHWNCMKLFDSSGAVYDHQRHCN
ncbi:ATP-dependent RNA helicase DEAH12, chloroplastic isoform X2 [Nematostella vectensis]|nr:ATP-dependent RNA helicase DEAH12, chloroplastic isoform X2 [Nematostella vectensis]